MVCLCLWYNALAQLDASDYIVFNFMFSISCRHYSHQDTRDKQNEDRGFKGSELPEGGVVCVMHPVYIIFICFVSGNTYMSGSTYRFTTIFDPFQCR